MEVLVTYATYQCARCQQALRIEVIPGGYGSHVYPDNTAIGACPNVRCERYEKRLRIKIESIDCEELPQ